MIGIYRKKKEMEYLLEFLIVKFPIHLCSYIAEFDMYTSTTVTTVFIGWKIW
jgi:hypothetical protein